MVLQSQVAMLRAQEMIVARALPEYTIIHTTAPTCVSLEAPGGVRETRPESRVGNRTTTHVNAWTSALKAAGQRASEFTLTPNWRA